MAERSLRTRLKDSAGGRTYADALAWGVRWESVRSAWFSRSGRWAEADDAQARMLRLEREYASEVGRHFMANPAREVEILLARIDSAIDHHQKQARDPDPRETERLQRWRRELLLSLADSRRATWGD